MFQTEIEATYILLHRFSKSSNLVTPQSICISGEIETEDGKCSCECWPKLHFCVCGKREHWPGELYKLYDAATSSLPSRFNMAAVAR